MWLILVALTAAVFLLVGILLFIRRNRREISIRSPWLLLCSHIGNMCEQISLLLKLSGHLPKHNMHWSNAIGIIFHFLYYFPYLLRGYRLHFVFYSQLDHMPANDAYFLQHIRQSQQIWLVVILVCIMLPLSILVVVTQVELDLGSYSPSSYTFESVYIGVLFTEELIFVLMIYSLRHVEKEYGMNRELVIVCVLWFFNSGFSLRSKIWFWDTELLVRNFVIMCVSVLYPLIKSYRQPEMKETLTLSTLYSVPLVLQNELSFEYFESFLQSKNYSLCAHPTKEEAMESAGYTVLNLYMMCKVYIHSTTACPAEQLLGELDAFQGGYSLLPEELVQVARKELREKEGNLEGANALQSFLYELLRTFYFPMFQRSPLFGALCKEVEQAEFRSRRAIFLSDSVLK